MSIKSRRIGSDFGSLGERTRRGGSCFVLVDRRAPGLLVEWSLKESGWWGRVAWLDGRDLRVGEIAADRLTPLTVVTPTASG